MTELAVQLPDASRRLDAIDRKILTVLQEDASLSVAEIGDRVGLSSTPCWKRIQRLEADGVIRLRFGGKRRSLRSVAPEIRRRRQRHAGGDGILSDGRRR
jgi:biotin operon repressor